MSDKLRCLVVLPVLEFTWPEMVSDILGQSLSACSGSFFGADYVCFGNIFNGIDSAVKNSL